ncbi:hypothetical protein YC2023_109689 [Brassica napus]
MYEIYINEGKVRVVLDAFKPLVFSMTVEFHSGEEAVIALRYERLHGFCRICSSLRHDQSKCPTTKTVSEEDDEGPSDKPDQGDKALSYRGAVESHPKGNVPEGDARRQNHQSGGKHDYKGKGIAYDGGKHATLAKGGPGRRYREQGRAPSRFVRQADYLPPRELQDSYVMATHGVKGLGNLDVGAHLEENQKLMLDAFTSGGNKETPGSKARRALQFEEKASGEVHQNMVGEIQTDGASGQKEVMAVSELQTRDPIGVGPAVVDTKKMEKVGDFSGGEEKEERKEDEAGLEVEGGSSEMVAGLGGEDGSLEYEMFEDGEEEELEGKVGDEMKATDTEMTVEDVNAFGEDVQMEENVNFLAGEKGRQGQKNKNGKSNAEGMGGNAKKRAVQCFASPRKKVMAKHLSKVGEKGTAPQKKASAKPKPDQD